VDFSLTDEQQMLAEAARALSSDLFGEAVARLALADDRAAGEKGWAGLHAAGLTALLVPDEFGGGGGNVLDACVVLTELSAALAPVPYLTSAVAVPAVLLALNAAIPGSGDALLRRVVDGEPLALVVDDQLRWPGTVGATSICLDWVPGRAALYVQDTSAVLRTDIDAVPGVDPLHPVGRLTGPSPLPPAADFAAGEAARRARATMRVASAAALTGCLEGAARLAWSYIATREQYGRPLASFQAIRHLAADLLVDLETCRSVSQGAAWTVDNEDVDSAERAAAIAKAWCGQAAVRSVETATQLLGGIGVTWESPAHLFLRNAHHFSAAYGDTRTLLRALGSEFINLRGKARHGSA
jgi:alkylation response protein AidB-like acyl-CoA dehydrogenase